MAEAQGIAPGMVAADARAIVPSLAIIDDIPGLNVKLLKALGKWCIRYTPFTAIDPPAGLILDISGCTHLWGSEKNCSHNTLVGESYPNHSFSTL